jgi:hypothetical protein
VRIFQLACYESGEVYGLHRGDDDDEKRNADRIATVLVYLEAPELSQGGVETLFTHRSMEEKSLKQSKVHSSCFSRIVTDRNASIS